MQANIPGIGRYSAGAICSIAYGENVPVVSSIFRLVRNLFETTAGRQRKSASESILGPPRATESQKDLGYSVECRERNGSRSQFIFRSISFYVSIMLS